MKALGNLLLTISLVSAMLSAATAYLVRPSLPDEAFQKTVDGDVEYARLASNAGRILMSDDRRDDLREQYNNGDITAEQYTNQLHSRIPLIQATPSDGEITEPDPDIETAPEAALQYMQDDTDGTQLTPGRLAQLRSAADDVADVDGVAARGALHVKSFSFERWPYWWVFALSAVGLFAGSMLVRAGTKAEIAAASATSPTDAGPSMTPDQALDGIEDVVTVLRRELPGMASDEARNHAIIERIGAAQKTHIMAFIDARPLLINRLGLGGYAELMDRFAAAERQINRAWSAAADGMYHESKDSLDTAAILLEETKPKLNP